MARNIILVIGDGMGYQHVNAGSFYLTGVAGQLSFERFYRCGVTTFAANSPVTDSGAAASAIATGHKVDRKTLSMSPHDKPYGTILEAAKGLGKSTGLVTTTPVNHATPAAFASHQPSRYDYEEVGYDFFLETQPDVIFGGGDPARGGIKYFSQQQIELAKSIGYRTVFNKEQMESLAPGMSGKTLGLFSGYALPYEFDRKPDEPSLSGMTAKALELLQDNPNGFFLFVEGGKIDWAGHDNDILRTVHDVLELHRTIQSIRRWMADRNDTLLIVTADHETGGLSVTNRGRGKIPAAGWSTTEHTTSSVPLYSTGPGSSLFNRYISNRLIDNTDIYKVMSSVFSYNGSLPDPPVVESVSPTSGEVPTGVISRFSAGFSDPDGLRDLRSCYLMINKTFASQKDVAVRYDTDSRLLFMLDESGTEWIGGYPIGSVRTIENSRCKLFCNATTTSKTGATLTVNWRILLKAPMSGKIRELWTCVIDDTGLRDGWNRRGKITIR